MHRVVWVDGQVIDPTAPAIILVATCGTELDRFERIVDNLASPLVAEGSPEPDVLRREEIDVEGASRAARLDLRYVEPAMRPDTQPVELRTAHVATGTTAYWFRSSTGLLQTGPTRSRRTSSQAPSV